VSDGEGRVPSGVRGRTGNNGGRERRGWSLSALVFSRGGVVDASAKDAPDTQGPDLLPKWINL
jgi:hypothetical protein